MGRRQTITGALHNFLGTYTSRNSGYDGYWLFSLLLDQVDAINIDLLHPGENTNSSTPDGIATRLAAAKFAAQLEKAGISISRFQEAQLSITKSPDEVRGTVNGHQCSGHEVRFAVTAALDRGKTCERSISIFVAPHDSRIEYRRSVASVERANDMSSEPRQTQIPIPGGSGLTPTGAMQFRDDWPGLFIRGDDAIPVASAVRRLQDQLKDVKNAEVVSALIVLSGIADIIERDVIVR